MAARAAALNVAWAALLSGAGVQAAAIDAGAESNICAAPPGPVAVGAAQWNGWGRDLDNTRYQPEPALRAADVPRLALKWAFGFRGSAVAGQPTVVDGRIFALSSAGRVYAIDSRLGCTYWTFDAATGTRTPISIGELAPSRMASYQVTPRHGRGSRHARQPRTPAHLEILKAPSAAFFGDDSGAVYALDAERGTLLWKTQVDAHPTARIVAAPTLYKEHLYVVVDSTEPRSGAGGTTACCTFRGAVAALDMATGRIQWKTYLIAEEPRPLPRTGSAPPEFGPAGVAASATPAIDVKRGLLYVTTAGASNPTAAASGPTAATSGQAPSAGGTPLADAVVALDLNDGSVRWSRQFAVKDAPQGAEFGASPVLRTLSNGRQMLLAAQKSGVISALDPDHGGDVLWQTRPVPGTPAGGVNWGMAADHRSVFAAFSGLLADPQNLFGSITALDMKTGMRRWYTPSPTPPCSWGQECPHAQSQAITVIPGVVFSGSMDGHLRAYSTIDGKITWDFDTARDFAAINGVKASGGSLDQGGATIVNGVIYINSGYGQHMGQPGNVLLALSVDGK